jgi:hypothetical protein
MNSTSHAVFGRVIFFLSALAIVVSSAAAIGFDNDDFLISSYSAGTIGVYDRDLTYKGLLEPSFETVLPLAFDLAGNLVAASQNSDTRDAEVRVYDRSGTKLMSRSFANRDLDNPADLDVAPNGNYYVATQFGRGVAEFSRNGEIIASFIDDIPAHMGSVAVLPGGLAWGGASPNPSNPEQNFVSIYDPATHDQIGSVPLDHGQKSVSHLEYSRTTNTVLIADYLGNAIVERDTSGNYLRTFTASGYAKPTSVTRGPGGDVFSVIFSTNNLYRWDADGNFLGVTSLADSVTGPSKIVWAGEAVPEPSTIGLGVICVIAMLRLRARAGCVPTILPCAGLFRSTRTSSGPYATLS